MAYSKKYLRDEAIKIISSDPDIHFISEVCSFLPINRDAFYNKNLHKDDKIKAALYKNKVALKSHLRKKWKDSDNATLNIALYRLIGTDKDRQKLSQQHVDHTTKGNELPKPLLDISELQNNVLSDNSN